MLHHAFGHVPTPKLFFYALLAVGAGMYFFVKGLLVVRTELRVANTALSKIAALALGKVAIAGKSEGRVRSAPFSGLPCLLAKSTIWIHRERDMLRVATIFTPPQPSFTLTDETGTVTVLAAGAELDLDATTIDPVGFVSDDTDALLAAHGLNPATHRIRVVEEVLPLDSAVYVCGTAIQPSIVPLDDDRAVPLPPDKPVVTGGPNGDLLISVWDRGGFARRLTLQSVGSVAGGGTLSLAGLAALVWLIIGATTAADPRLGAAVAAGNLRPLAARVNHVDLDRRDAAGRTALMRAARAGDLGTLQSLLASGAEPNAIDPRDRTALDYAMLRDSAPAVKALIAGGASLALQDRNGDTALHLAARGGDPTLVQALLAAGANPGAVNARNQTPLDVARGLHTSNAHTVALVLQHAATGH
ncbi:MAG: ankyrin repeat domain-containing protein [Vulcanimicrobiaceae bacterium]